MCVCVCVYVCVTMCVYIYILVCNSLESIRGILRKYHDRGCTYHYI